MQIDVEVYRVSESESPSQTIGWIGRSVNHLDNETVNDC